MVDNNTLECPSYVNGVFSFWTLRIRRILLTPVPKTVDSHIGIIHGNIAHSELLVSDRYPILATIKNKIYNCREHHAVR